VLTDHSNIHSGAHATIGQGQNFCAFPPLLVNHASRRIPKRRDQKYEQKRDRNYADKKDGVLKMDGAGGQYRSQYLSSEGDQWNHASRAQENYGEL